MKNHNGGSIGNVAKQIFNDERNNGSYVHNDSWFISLRALQTNNGEPQQLFFLTYISTLRCVTYSVLDSFDKEKQSK